MNGDVGVQESRGPRRRVEGWGMVREKIVICGCVEKRTTTMKFKKIDGGARWHVERWVMGARETQSCIYRWLGC